MELSHFEEIVKHVCQQRPEKNEAPRNRDVFPFTQADAALLLSASGTECQQSVLAPLSKSLFAVLMTEEFLPALRRLEFMGIDPMPEVHVFASWSDTDNTGIETIRYPLYLDLSDEDERDAAFDRAVTNTRDDEIPLTVGRVPPMLFFRAFCHAAIKTDCSTSAHRRYKNCFPGTQFHLIVDADYNNVELHVHEPVAAAMNDAVQCFIHGR